MKYTYRFANGDVNEIEVTEDQAFALADLDRLEYNNDHANTRRHISLEMAMEDEGMQFGSTSCWEQALSADNVNTIAWNKARLARSPARSSGGIRPTPRYRPRAQAFICFTEGL